MSRPERVGRLCFAAWMAASTIGIQAAQAAHLGLKASPPLGWSSWSSFEASVNETTVHAVAQSLVSTLKPAGYVYVNIDAGWYQNPDTAVDAYGRWIADPSKFPSGMAALGSYLHSLGLKFGIYVSPGIPMLAVTQNTPVQGTPYHAADIAIPGKLEVTYTVPSIGLYGGTMYYIDYTKPGAQAFINSWANLFASWGVDYIKLDGVGDADIPDVEAWSKALLLTGRPIYLGLANHLDPANAPIWSAFSDGWRISPDIESYNGSTLTTWNLVEERFTAEPYWLAAAPYGGWNDLDSLDAGSPEDGLSSDERQTMVTFWALAASPLIVGDDPRNLDSAGFQLLTNPEAIAVDQQGIVAAPINNGSAQQVWTALEPDGTYAVGLFNLSDSPATVTVPWSGLGFTGLAAVRDHWRRAGLGWFSQSFSASLNPHASMLLGVQPLAPVRYFPASGATLSGGAALVSSTVSPGGLRVHLPAAGATATFSPIEMLAAGNYNLTINYINGDPTPRSATLIVNGNPVPLNFPGAGDWAANLTNQGLSTAISLNAGANSIGLAAAAGPAPDFIGITLQPRW
ncbi:MAG TPA: alpha-galactosidase [Bryobacteraceae bacterium]|nr:alpha-galactosidase [Bryobacteraceae bacterium]